jgi:hypothetical protein
MNRFFAFFFPLFIFLNVNYSEAATFKLKVAIQTTPIKIANEEIKKKVKNIISEEDLYLITLKQAQRFFSNPLKFTPSEVANTFLLIELTYGWATAFHKSSDPNIKCIKIKSEYDSVGSIGCDYSIDKAINMALIDLTKKHQQTFEYIEKNERLVDWLELVGKGVVVYNKNIEKEYKPFDDSYGKKNRFKSNVRSLIGNYFRDGTDNKPINFFKPEDLISILLLDRDQALAHELFILNIISNTPKRWRLWPFTMLQAVKSDVPLSIINAIKAKKGTFDDFKDFNRNTPLIIASMMNNHDLVNFLLEQGSDSNALNKASIGAIQFVAYWGELELYNTLIKKGTNPSVISKDGASTLHFAAASKNALLINQVIRDGVKLNQTDSNGYSALFYAYPLAHEEFKEKHRVAINILIKAGVNIHIKSKAGKRADENYQENREEYLVAKAIAEEEERQRLARIKYEQKLAAAEAEQKAKERQARAQRKAAKKAKESREFWGNVAKIAIAVTPEIINGLNTIKESKIRHNNFIANLNAEEIRRKQSAWGGYGSKRALIKAKQEELHKERSINHQQSSKIVRNITFDNTPEPFSTCSSPIIIGKNGRFIDTCVKQQNTTSNFGKSTTSSNSNSPENTYESPQDKYIRENMTPTEYAKYKKLRDDSSTQSNNNDVNFDAANVKRKDNYNNDNYSQSNNDSSYGSNTSSNSSREKEDTSTKFIWVNSIKVETIGTESSEEKAINWMKTASGNLRDYCTGNYSASSSPVVMNLKNTKIHKTSSGRYSGTGTMQGYCRVQYSSSGAYSQIPWCSVERSGQSSCAIRSVL